MSRQEEVEVVTLLVVSIQSTGAVMHIGKRKWKLLRYWC